MYIWCEKKSYAYKLKCDEGAKEILHLAVLMKR